MIIGLIITAAVLFFATLIFKLSTVKKLHKRDKYLAELKAERNRLALEAAKYQSLYKEQVSLSNALANIDYELTNLIKLNNKTYTQSEFSSKEALINQAREKVSQLSAESNSLFVNNMALIQEYEARVREEVARAEAEAERVRRKKQEEESSRRRRRSGSSYGGGYDYSSSSSSSSSSWSGGGGDFSGGGSSSSW